MALTDQLISYWHMDEASGVRADSVGGNHLTDVNTVTSFAGKLSLAAQFVAANSETLTKTSNASLELGGNQLFTLTGWIKYQTIAPAGVTSDVIDKQGGPQAAWRLFNNFGNLVIRIFTGTGSSGAISAQVAGVNVIDTWYYFIAWYDGAFLNLSINNGAPTSTANTLSVWDSTPWPDLRFGSGYTGLIDEVGFWKRVLTGPEMTQLYNGGAGFSPVTENVGFKSVLSVGTGF